MTSVDHHAPKGGKPWQSKLEGVADVIRDLRRHRKTYTEIARILTEEHGIKVAPSSVHNFVKVRARRRGVYALPKFAPCDVVAHPTPAATSATKLTNQSEPASHVADAAAMHGLSPSAACVFRPLPERQNIFDDEDLQLNDLLK